MVSGKNGVTQVVKLGLTSLTLVALTMGLSLVKTSFDYLLGATFITSHSFSPSQSAHGFIALLLVNQGLEINQYRDSHGLVSFKASQSRYCTLCLPPELQFPGIHKSLFK